MMKLKKIAAIALAVMMIAMVGLAWATSTPEVGGDGETGTWGGYGFPTDTETVDTSKTVIIKKDLVVYNPNSHTKTSNPVYAPAYSYVYTVTSATVNNYTVTDDSTDHASGTAVQAPVKSGNTTGLVVNGGTAGDATSAVGYLDLSNSTALDASSTGSTNSFDITLNFSNVSFTQPGVYRYEIVESIIDAEHSTAKTYDQVAVADGTSNTRYLDVYVDGNLAIYGYVCMGGNNAVTSDTAKTNGFVVASNGQDTYYTYDLTLSKDVVNDNFGTGHDFPFTVLFNNTENYATTYTITETVGTGSTGITPTAAQVPTWSGVAKVKEGGNIVYSGIPAGIDVEVYETNDMTGVTYTVATSVNNGTAITDNNVSSGSAPTTASTQAGSADTGSWVKTNAFESTKAIVDTSKIASTNAQSVAITNTLLLISPTGYVARFAPYALILIGGIVLLVVAKKHKKHTDEE